MAQTTTTAATFLLRTATAAATEHAAALTPDEAVAAYGDLLQCAIDAAIPATPR